MFSFPEIFSILSWWIVFFVIGFIFLPLSTILFSKFYDKGYIFAKVIGAGLLSYVVFVAGVLHILPFSLASIVLVLWIFALINFYFLRKYYSFKNFPIKTVIFEEVIFLCGIFLWSFVRGHEPSINGLEKFMDFGFVNSILRTTWQPAVDMWFPPLPINYYYFGHLLTAVVTKLSFVNSAISYNIMIATLCSLTFSLSFSIGLNLINLVSKKRAYIGGLITAVLVTFSGNLQVLYSFFKPYVNENPVPFWNLPLLINSFPNSYWYPNATRFIPFTIHEFPIYSFVVSDLHGHVLDIPFVLLVIALSIVIFITKEVPKRVVLKLANFKFKLPEITVNYWHVLTVSFLLSIMYMTNVWDGLIYMALIFAVIFIKNWHSTKFVSALKNTLLPALLIIVLFFLFSLPFNLTFKPFAHGVGLICAPDFLIKIKHIGPLLFEADHCQRSPLWQLATLYGFFYFFVIAFILYIKLAGKKFKAQISDVFVFILILISTLLILFPELFYLKDIYPAHYRANTMFKLVYQAFIMLSISSGYIIVRILTGAKNKIVKIIFIIPAALLLGSVLLYPYFAVNSYYGELKNYSGIDGTKYLATRLPEDYEAIKWINQNISGRPIMLEAQGDSYTDYERISSNTGLPTVLGWTVHEWLWRGSYDIPSPRIEEVKEIYEGKDENKTKKLIDKHNVEFIYVGGLEKQKYPLLNEDKIEKLADVVFQSGNTKIYKITQ